MNSTISTLFDLSGKSALVSGATGAFGAAAARALAGAGAHVTLAGANEAKLDELRAEFGDAAAIVVGRPDSEDGAERLVAAAAADGRGIDILVAASGMSIVKPALQLDLADWDRVMDANVRQSWLLARAAGRVMVEQARGGKIVLVSSVRATLANAAGTSGYGASKAAVDMLTKSFAVEWGKHGITVNAIAPAVFRSDLTAWMFDPAGEERRKGIVARLPLGRLAEPDDFAGAIVFLCGRASDYVTGDILHVDGGYSVN